MRARGKVPGEPRPRDTIHFRVLASFEGVLRTNLQERVLPENIQAGAEERPARQVPGKTRARARLPGAETQVSSVPEKPRDSTLWLPCVSSWLRYPAGSDQCPNGGPAQSAGPTPSGDHQWLYATSHGH